MEKVRYSAFDLSENLFTWLAKITRHCLCNGYIEMPGLAEGAEVDDYLLVEHLRLCSEQGTLRWTEAADGTFADVLVGSVELWIDGYPGEMVDFLLDSEWEDFGLVFDDVAPDGEDADGVEVDAAPPASPVLVDMNDALEQDVYVYGGILDDEDDDDDDHDVGGGGTDAGAPVAGPSKSAICGVCHGEFATDKNLMKHCRTVCKERPLYRQATYECPGCGRKFRRSDVLQKHRIRKEH